MTTVLGIDPGQDGAAVLLVADEVRQVWRWRLLRRKGGSVYRLTVGLGERAEVAHYQGCGLGALVADVADQATGFGGLDLVVLERMVPRRASALGLAEEPPPADHPLLRHPRALITPHIGSRTYESVPRQAMRATLNLVNFLSGAPDVIQANKF
jgi:hypothetical protein